MSKPSVPEVESGRKCERLFITTKQGSLFCQKTRGHFGPCGLLSFPAASLPEPIPQRVQRTHEPFTTLPEPPLSDRFPAFDGEQELLQKAADAISVPQSSEEKLHNLTEALRPFPEPRTEEEVLSRSVQRRQAIMKGEPALIFPFVELREEGARTEDLVPDSAAARAAKVRDDRQRQVGEWAQAAFGTDETRSLPQRGISSGN